MTHHLKDEGMKLSRRAGSYPAIGTAVRFMVG